MAGLLCNDTLAARFEDPEKQIGKTRARPSQKAPWNHDENLQHLAGSLLKHSAGVQ